MYYQEGFMVEADSTAEAQASLVSMVYEDALGLVYEDDGLAIRDHGETEMSNGFVAWVSEYEPDIDIEYTTDKMPAKIATELEKLQKDNKNDKS
jgi:hypothetical protein